MAIIHSELLESAKRCELNNIVTISSAPESLSMLEDALRDARGALCPKEEDYKRRRRLVVTTREMVQGIFDLLESAKRCELNNIVTISSTPESLSMLEDALRDARGALCPKEEDYKRRRRLVVTTREMVHGIFGDYIRLPNVEPFGSFIMDMFTASSDLDLSVDFSDGSISSLSRAEKIGILKRIVRVLFSYQRQGRVYGVSPILKARVPIVKYVDRSSQIECDISVENKDGVLKSFIISQFSLIDQRCQILCFLMKAWAKEQNINSSKDHTLNSLSIILLVIFHLQTRNPPILPPLSALLKGGTNLTVFQVAVHRFKNFGGANEETISELFISLLNKLYSVKTLWKQGLCASAYEGSWIFKEWDSGTARISVEDFTDRAQNCARPVEEKEFDKIYHCIHRALSQLRRFMNGEVDATHLKRFLFGSGALNTGEILKPVLKKKVKKIVKKLVKKKVGPKVLQPMASQDSDEKKIGSLKENEHQSLNVNAFQAVGTVVEPKMNYPSASGSGMASHPHASGSGPATKTIHPASQPHQATNSKQPAAASANWSLTIGNVGGGLKEAGPSEVPALKGPKRSNPPASESGSPGKKIRPNLLPQEALYLQPIPKKKVKKTIKKKVDPKVVRPIASLNSDEKKTASLKENQPKALRANGDQVVGCVEGGLKKAGPSQVPTGAEPKMNNPPASGSGSTSRPVSCSLLAANKIHAASQPHQAIKSKQPATAGANWGLTVGNVGDLKEAAPYQVPAYLGPKRSNPPAFESKSSGKKIRPTSQPQEAFNLQPFLRPHRPIPPAVHSNPVQHSQQMSSMLPNISAPTIPPPSARIPGTYAALYRPEYGTQNSPWPLSQHIPQALAPQPWHEFMHHPVQRIHDLPEHLNGLRESVRLYGTHNLHQPTGSHPWQSSYNSRHRYSAK